MKIIWHGHACFEVQSDEGIVVFDPYKDNSVPGVYMEQLKADEVFISHSHGDHNGIDKVDLLNRGININVEKIYTYHDDKQGQLRGNNIIHIVSLENMKIAHLGDLGCDIDDDRLSNCDIFMIPVGGHYTIDAFMAKHIIDKYNPRIVIPMHYRGETFGYDVISTVDEFISICGNVNYSIDNTVFIDKGTPKQTIILKNS